MQHATDFSAARARTAAALVGGSRRVLVGLAAAAMLTAVLLLMADDRTILGAAFGLIMLAIAAVDASQYIIPDRLVVAALALGAISAAAAIPGDSSSAFFNAGLRAAATAGLFLMVQTAYRWLRGREGMGLGDVKLAAVAGVWLDWPTIPIAIEIAAGVGLAFCLIGGALTRRPIRLTGKLPFGLFFAPAIWLSWLVQSMME